MDPEKLTDFISCTGATEGEALNILFLADYDIERAVDMFFSGAAGSLDNPQTSHLGDMEEVRQPIPAKRQRLLDSPIQFQPMVPSSMGGKKNTSAFASGSGTNTSEKEQALSKLFQPPFSIMHSGTFQEASTAAAADNKWLMVNIQKEDEFGSHMLNRDVWSSESVQNVIKCHFIFWQQQDFTMEALWYAQKYLTAPGSSSATTGIASPALPHIGIIDPATGQLMKALIKPNQTLSKDMILERLQDFLSNSPSPSEHWKQHHQRRASPPSTPRDPIQSAKPALAPPVATPSSAPIPISSQEGGRARTTKSSASTQAQGFSCEEVVAVMGPLCNEAGEKEKPAESPDNVATVVSVVRIHLPGGGSCVEKFTPGSDMCTVGGLLSRIVNKFSEEERERRFDVFYSFPPTALSKRMPLETLAFQSLVDMKMSNEKITVRFCE